ncbi:MAG: hypothetical protein ACKVS9_14110 [Phycisphaerae bacterium]
MRRVSARLGVAAAALCTLGAAYVASVGCGSSQDPSFAFVSPFFLGSGFTPPGGGTGGDDDGDGFFDDDEGGVVDACGEQTERKFVRVIMRNTATNEHIHYFAAFIAFEQGEVYPAGAVCPDDRSLYTDFGYVFIEADDSRNFGNYCIVGPAYLYFHRDGQFRSSTTFASGIAPAQGSASTFDAFFTASGAPVPAPNLILFHNPGSGAGRALKVATANSDPCDSVLFTADPDCDQDAFYYVDANDRPAGSTTLGRGSAVRTPSDIQGSGCTCTGSGNPVTDAAHQLAPGTQAASDVDCNEFLRGGAVEYVFLRDDSEPPFPQLVWRVTDAGGTIAQSFDERARIP